MGCYIQQLYNKSGLACDIKSFKSNVNKINWVFLERKIIRTILKFAIKIVYSSEARHIVALSRSFTIAPPMLLPVRLDDSTQICWLTTILFELWSVPNGQILSQMAYN